MSEAAECSSRAENVTKAVILFAFIFRSFFLLPTDAKN
jgi:hypothetical protein